MTAQQRQISLMIIGSEKSGTTSLFRLLADHPGVHTHEQREMTWFRTDEYANGWEYAYGKYFDGGDGGKLLIAKDVFAMYSREALERLHAHNPAMQIVAMLRNPVDRAYSAYWYARRRGREPIRDFEQALAAEKSRLDADPVGNRPNGYLANGRYAEFLQQAVALFGREQVRICFTDDLKTDATALCQAIFADLGLDAGHVPSTTAWQNRSGMARSEGLAKAMNRGFRSQGVLKRLARLVLSPRIRVWLRHTLLRINEKDFTPPPMDAGLRRRLAGEFSSANTQLAELAGSDIPRGWR